MITKPCKSGERIALTGVSGHLGQAVFAQLDFVEECPVVCLVRTNNNLPVEAHPFVGDLGMDDFRPFLKNCSGLVHCAFAHTPGAYRGGEGDDPAAFWDLNVTGTIRLLEQAREMGVRRVVLFSSRAVYANSDFDAGEVIDETYLPRPDTHYGIQKLAIEGFARLYSDARMSVTVLRPTGVYGGPAKTNKWRDLFFDAAQGVFPAVNKTSTEVHAKTIGQACGFLLGRDDPAIAGRVFNLSEVRVSVSQILEAAGFECSSMPLSEAMAGPELKSDDIQTLGVQLATLKDLQSSAKKLCMELGL